MKLSGENFGCQGRSPFKGSVLKRSAFSSISAQSPCRISAIFITAAGACLAPQQAFPKTHEHTLKINISSIVTTLIPANVPTPIRVSAQISGTNFVPDTVQLVQERGTGAHPGLMTLSGSGPARHRVYSGTYMAKLPPGQTRLAVLAMFKKAGPVISAAVPVTAIRVPPGFTVNTATLAAGGPIAFTNFGNKYGSGGTLPGVGAAEITITHDSSPSGSLADFVQQELRGSSIASQTTVQAGGASCIEVKYSEKLSPSLRHSNAAAFCRGQGALYKFYLTYFAGDPGANTYIKDFQDTLNSAQFP